MTGQQATSLDKLYPTAGNNAIETAAIALSWSGPRDDRLFAPFLEWEGELGAQGYSAPGVIQAFEVGLNAAGGIDSRSSVKAGYTFAKKSSHGVALREVTLRDNQFLFTVRDYSRWANFLADAEKVLARLLQLLVRHEKEIASISLQYQDKFLWRDMERAFPTKLALRGSGFVPLDILANSPQWHSNQGFFVGSAGNSLGPRLDNINLSLTVENHVPTLGVLMVHQYGPLSISGERLTLPALKPMLDAAHLANKDYLAMLLADELCKKISLGGG
jgi:uncharacterized protein (TIGR04255 family)